MSLGQKQEIPDLHAGAHLHQAFPQKDRQTAENVGDRGLGVGQIYDGGDTVTIYESAAAENLCFNMSYSGDRGHHAHVL